MLAEQRASQLKRQDRVAADRKGQKDVVSAGWVEFRSLTEEDIFTEH